MFGPISLVGGILLRVNPQWFHGASTIGLVLIIVGAVVLLLELAAVIGGGAAFWKSWKKF